MSTRSTRSMNPVPVPVLVIALAAAAATLMSVTGCNMVKGLGQDISGAAESTQQAFASDPEPDNSRP